RSRRLVCDALGVESTHKLARLKHLAHDIAATDEFALDVELRQRRPVRKLLDALAYLVRFEAIHMRVIDAEIVEDLHELAGKAALRKRGRSLHEKHDIVLVDGRLNELIDA